MVRPFTTYVYVSLSRFTCTSRFHDLRVHNSDPRFHGQYVSQAKRQLRQSSGYIPDTPGDLAVDFAPSFFLCLVMSVRFFRHVGHYFSNCEGATNCQENM